MYPRFSSWGTSECVSASAILTSQRWVSPGLTWPPKWQMLALGEELWNSLESFTMGRIKQWLLLARMSGSITLVVFISLPREFHQDVINSVDLKKKNIVVTPSVNSSHPSLKRKDPTPCRVTSLAFFSSSPKRFHRGWSKHNYSEV